MSGMNVNGTNNVFGVNNVNGAQNVNKNEFINTVFGPNGGKYVPNTPFNGEEQHILGILVNAQQNNILLIED